MADEKPRATSGRKKTTESTGAAGEAVTGGRSRKVTPKASGATEPKATKKPAAKKAATTKAPAKPSAAKPAARKATTPRAKRAVDVVPEPTAEAIAERAYLLWERGEPGDPMEHWLRAEAELQAA